MSMLKLNKNINLHDQNGFAAIIVAFVIIIVLSLTTLGFVSLMRNNQQLALNKQLSDQAYYAAESGINDAAQAYNAGYSLPKEVCPLNAANVDTNQPGYKYLLNPDVNTSTNTSVTCLLMNPSPQSIFYTVSANQPSVVEMQGCTVNASADPTAACGSGTAATVNTINISFKDQVNDSVPAPGLTPGCTSFSSDPTWQYQNLLRIELVPLSYSGAITRSALISNAYTAYLCPDGTAASGTNYPVAGNTGVNSGQILDTHCTVAPGATGPNPSHLCSASLDVSAFNDSTYFIIMRGIYSNPINATITLNGTGGQLNIGDAQMLVDSTGKAQSVLKRIQARVPLTNEYSTPNAVVQGEICKQLLLAPTTQYSYNNSNDLSPCNNTFRSQLP